MKSIRPCLAALLALAFLVNLAGCTPKPVIPLSVFAAGSLIQPFNELEKAFETRYPYIDVLPEYHGSIQVMRHATDLHEKIDVIATADELLIPMLMYGTVDPETGSPYANWHLRFASNRMTIAYTPQSRHADEINADHWAEILLRPDVKVGLSDPRFDAAGYRMLMIFQLAETQLDKPALFEDMFNGQFRFGIKTEAWESGVTVIHVPEVLETKPGSHILMRGGSIALLALLESGDIDYAFEYESVARQHNLQMVALPDSLNLGSPDVDYSSVMVKLDFQRFASVKPEFGGGRIGYGITIPTNAPHPREAQLFLEFLLGEEGRALMDAMYHPLYDPVLAVGYENLPPGLQKLVEPAP